MCINSFLSCLLLPQVRGFDPPDVLPLGRHEWRLDEHRVRRLPVEGHLRQLHGTCAGVVQEHAHAAQGVLRRGVKGGMLS